MEEKFHENHNIKILKLDAKNLSSINDSIYDIVLCFGPYYHISNSSDRYMVINECKRICKKNGIIAFAYINKFYANAMYIKNGIYFSKSDYELLSNGDYSKLGHKDAFLGISYFSSPEEIENELKLNKLTVIDHVATDGIYGLFHQRIDEMSESEYEALLKFHSENCRNYSTLGMSSHGMVIVRKET